MFNFRKGELELNIPTNGLVDKITSFVNKNITDILLIILIGISTFYFIFFLQNGLGLAYNDARSHLDIGRRVIEGLKPGIAQLGSVWLPLPHILMIPTVWEDFAWHSGLSGAFQSMISFVATGLLIYLFLKKLGVGMLGRLVGVTIFVANLNVLYLQSTAMTELLLIATLMAGVFYLTSWFKNDNILDLIKAAFWIMLSTLVRYEGWFLFGVAMVLIAFQVYRKKGYRAAEGTVILFATLAGLGIALWFLWNLVIFGDPLYFIFGPYSAATQQNQLAEAGVLATKGNLFFSIKVYLFALAYNSNAFISILGLFGAIALWLDRRLSISIKIASLTLIAPLAFNVLALYMGQSVLFVQGLSGNTWFNVRYGIMLLPAIAIFIGYLIHRVDKLKFMVIGLIAFVLFFSFINQDAVTLDDARVGSSQKNVSQVSGWLANNTSGTDGFILISAASHDAIIFSSGLPMMKYIHEGTGNYWDSATTSPDRWARWIVMRTNDQNDLTFRLVSQTKAYKNGWYTLVDHYPFADIYELKKEHEGNLNTKAILGPQR